MFNFWPLHKHDYKVIRWRLVHQPEHEPSRRIFRMKCKSCGKERNIFPEEERNPIWENKNRHLERFWLGNEKYID